jgi:GntR family transcriptional regulator, transcriptional repressor for pyruvate dehydrogenase complex
MKIESIKGQSAPERVINQILENLETGQLQPGDRLPTQDKLSEMFGVGRSSIREATNALAIMGVLEITQGKGTYIKENAVDNLNPSNMFIFENFIEGADLFNLMEIREIIECHIAEKAANIASEEQLSILEGIVDRLGACENDARRFMVEDMKFHVELANSAKLPEAGEIIKIIHSVINKKLPVAIDAQKGGYLRGNIESARNTYKYIRRGEGKQAARCLRNHLRTAREPIKGA